MPCISHQTDSKERRRILAAFESGELPVLATSRVLNEGVDLPAAEVAIVLSRPEPFVNMSSVWDAY